MGLGEFISETISSLPENLIENANRKGGDFAEKWIGDGYVDRELETIEAVRPLEIFGWDTGLYEDISPGSGPNGEIMLWDCDRWPESPACGGGWNPERMIDFIGRFNVIDTRCFKCISWTYYLAGLAIAPVSFCSKKPECQKDQGLEDEHREGKNEEENERGDFPPGNPNDLMYVIEVCQKNVFEIKHTATGGGRADCMPGLMWHYTLESGVKSYTFDKKYRLPTYRWKERESSILGSGGTQGGRPEIFNEQEIRWSDNRRRREVWRKFSNDNFPEQEPLLTYYYPGEYYTNSFGFLYQFELGITFFEFYRELENGSYELAQNVLRTNLIGTHDPTGKSDLNIYYGRRGDLAAYFELEGGLLLSKYEYESELVPSGLDGNGRPYQCDYVREVIVKEKWRYDFHLISPIQLEEDDPPVQNMDKDCCNSDAMMAIMRKLRKISKYVGCEDNDLENSSVPNCWLFGGEDNDPYPIKTIPQFLEALMRFMDRSWGYWPQRLKIKDADELNPDQDAVVVEAQSMADAIRELFSIVVEIKKSQPEIKTEDEKTPAEKEAEKLAETHNEVVITKMIHALIYEVAAIHKMLAETWYKTDAIAEYLDFKVKEKKVPLPLAVDITAGQKGFGANGAIYEDFSVNYLKRLLTPREVQIIATELAQDGAIFSEELAAIRKDAATAAAANSIPVRGRNSIKTLLESALLGERLLHFLNREDIRKTLGQQVDFSEWDNAVERGYPNERTETTPYGLPEKEAPRVYRRTRRRSSAGGK